MNAARKILNLLLETDPDEYVPGEYKELTHFVEWTERLGQLGFEKIVSNRNTAFKKYQGDYMFIAASIQRKGIVAAVYLRGSIGWNLLYSARNLAPERVVDTLEGWGLKT